MPPISEKGKLVPSFNEEARRAHRRQSFWQISLPLITGILLVVALFILVMRGGTGSIEHSAQIASILLAIPLLVTGLVFFVLLIAAYFGLNALIKWLPPQSYKLQRLAKQAGSAAIQVAMAAKQPFLLIESWGNAVDRVIHRRG